MFRYLLSTTALLVLLNYAAHADTTYVAPGPVSGIWTTVGSPYLIYGGDIEVQESHTLTISAGVEVLFAGRYHLIVGGRLFAEGVLGDSILFSRAYPTEDSKWFGIRFDYAYEGSCLSYCRIEYVYHDDPEVEMRRGAVWIDNCSPLISHCLFTHNDAGDLGRGGALYLYFNCQSTIEYCHFIENRAYQYAGAIYISMDSSPTIYHCLFKENVVCHLNGGAINIGAGGEAVIHDNIFMGNLANNGAGKGGAICLWSGYGFYGSYSTIYNNLFIHNAGSFGGAIYSRYDASILYNNTFFGNNSSYGPAIFVKNQSNYWPTIYNSIFWGNGPHIESPVELDSESAVSINYSDVQYGWHGTGIIDADPLFCAAAPGENFYLSQYWAGQSEQSPCVDAGDPGSFMISGTTRIDGIQDTGIVDMGFHATYPYGRYPYGYSLTLSPLFTPVWIPANGGEFTFAVELENVRYTPVMADLWTEVIFPDGTLYSSILLRPGLSLLPLNTYYRELVQIVPANAPSGDYIFISNAGVYPDSIITKDSFQFTKFGVGLTPAYDLDGWMSHESSHQGQDPGMSQPQFSSISPNPFNPTTTITFDLPVAAQVWLDVFDINGRNVTSHQPLTTSHYYIPGTHAITFDGSNLSSGIYFYRLEAGEFTASGKMVLLK